MYPVLKWTQAHLFTLDIAHESNQMYHLLGLQWDVVITTVSKVKSAHWGTQLRLHNFNEIVIL